jgi:hypothetical protein
MGQWVLHGSHADAPIARHAALAAPLAGVAASPDATLVLCAGPANRFQHGLAGCRLGAVERAKAESCMPAGQVMAELMACQVFWRAAAGLKRDRRRRGGAAHGGALKRPSCP